MGFIEEQSYVLEKGGLINGLTFPLWDETVTFSGVSLFQLDILVSTYPYSLTCFTLRDPDGQPNLSPEQAKVSTIWRRPALGTHASPDRLRQQILPQEILQHIVTDCSVCASMSVCLEHARRFGSNVSILPSCLAFLKT